MLKELEETLKSHQTQISKLQKEINEMKIKTNGVQKLAYTVKEAAVATGIKETTLRTWINEGKLHATQSGKNYLIPCDVLIQFLNP